MRSGLEPGRVRGRRRVDPPVDRRRRDLPGQPDAPARGAVPRRSLAAVPAPADRRSRALRGLPRPRAEPVHGRAARDRLGLARAVPVGHRGTAWSRRTRSRAPAPVAATGRRIGALACELLALGEGPRRERDDRRRAAQRPRPGLPAGERPRPAPVPARADRRGPAPRQHGHRPARAGPRRLRPPRRLVPRRLDHRRAQDPGDGAARGAGAGPPRARTPASPAGSGPDGAMGTSILIRSFVADGERLTPARRRRDHLAQRPGGGVGRDRREGARPAVGDRRARGRVSDRVPSAARRACRPARLDRRRAASRPMRRHLSAFDRGFQLGDGVFETLRARGGRPTELDEHLERLRRSADGPRHRAARPARKRDIAAGIAALLAAEGLDGPGRRRVDPDHREPRRDHGARPAAAASTSPPTIVIQAWPVAAAARGPPRARAPPRRERRPARSREPAGRAQDDEPRRLRLRAPRGPPRRRGRRAVPDRSTATSPRRRAPTSSSSAGGDARPELATPALDCAILPGTTRTWILGWAATRGPRAGGGLADARRSRRRRRGVPVLERRRRSCR